MTDQLLSIIRHWITALLAIITLWLVGMLALDAGHQKILNDAAGQLVTPLVTILGLVAVAVWRMALTWLGNLFRAGSGENGNGGRASGGTALLLLGTMAALMGGLPSCSPALPLRIGVETDYGSAAYSSKRGIEVDVDAISAK